MKKTLAWGWIDGFCVAAHSKEAPTQEEWAAYVEDARKINAKGVLVYSEGGAPSALQRKMLREAVMGHSANEPPAPVAILSKSAAMRVAITALNLFFDNQLKIFESHEIKEALQYLQAPEALHPALQKKLEDLFLTLL